MDVIVRLASSLGRRDEKPNQQLALEIAEKADKLAVKQLIRYLGSSNSAIQSDCIKVLYEIGERRPALIAPYATTFLDLLDDKNNRLVWGAMAALDCIASSKPQPVNASLRKILAVANAGSVITRDHAVGILIKLAGIPKYERKASLLILDQLKHCPPNQFPMYVEDAFPVMLKRRKAFVAVMMSKVESLPKESQKKRVWRVLKRVENSM